MNNQLKNLKLKIKRPKSLFFDIVGAIVLGAIIVGLVSFLWPKGAEAAWYTGSWLYREKITIDHTKISGTTDLSNFPVLISITDTNLKDNALSTGNDILFTSSDGTTKLDHEIESYTSATGVLVAWVRIPTLSPGKDTDIYMYYGNASASDQSNKTGVWDANYVGVWHLKEDPSTGTEPRIQDSTSNTLNLRTIGSMAAGQQVAGTVNGSLNFDGNNDYLCRDTNNDGCTGGGLDDNGTESQILANSPITLESWFYSDSPKYSTSYPLQNNFGRIVQRATSYGNETNYTLAISDDGGATNRQIEFSFWNQSLNTADNAYTDNAWHHVAAVYDGSGNWNIYIDGSSIASQSSVTPATGTTTSAQLSLGQLRNAIDLWDGKIDETRVSNSARSAGWIATEYNNQSSPSTFIKTGLQETSPVVLYLAFDDGQGTTANDSSGQSNNGTLAGATLPTWQSEDLCVSSKCLFFGGDPAEVTVANTVSGVKSVGFWVRPKTNGEYMLDLDGGTHYIWGNNGTITATGFSSPTIYVNSKVSSTLTANAWQYVEVTTSTAIDASAIHIGKGNTTYFTGFIDEIKMYDSVRTAAQVKTDYASRGSVKGVSAQMGGSNQSYLSNGLVGYWKMDEATGTSVADSSGTGNTGTFVVSNPGRPTWFTGKFGGSVGDFNNNNYIDAGSSTTLKITGALTVSAWVKPDTSCLSPDQGCGFIGNANWGGVGGRGYHMGWYSDGTFRFTIEEPSAGGTVSTSTSTYFTANTWVHVIGTYDGSSKMSLYINGKLAATTTGNTPTTGATYNLRIGTDPQGGWINPPFNGNIDEARVYNRALSPKEVSDLYNWAPGPVGYWNFEEKSGTAANDTSGRGKTGTLGGDGAGADVPSWSTGKYGGALNFDGGDYVNISASDDFDFNTGDFTYAAWVKTTQNCTGYKVYIGTYGGTPNSWLGCNNSTGNVLVYSRDSDNVQGNSGESTTSINDGTWHYITGVKKSNTLYIYVDGVLENSNTANFTGNHTSNATYDIGRNNTSDGYYANAVIDEVKIYNYARTQKQIVSDMNAGHPAVGSPVGSSVAHWKLDQGYGTNADDSTPNNNDLTLSSASWTNSGKFGKAFNGTNAVWLSRADDADFDVTATDDYAVSLWFKSDSADNPAATEYLVNKANATTAGYAVYANTDGTICFGIDDDTTWGPDISSCTPTDVYDATWHHLVAVRDYSGSDKTLIYVDGVLKDSDADSTTATLANSLSFYLGDRDGIDNGDEFSGDLDEVKVYRYALTADEVKTEFNRGSSLVLGAAGNSSTYSSQAANQEYCVPGDPSACSGPVGEWKFEEDTGGTTNDTSGNGNVGAWNGTSSHWTRGKIGKAGSFNGSDDYVSISDSNNTLDINSSFTLESWVKLTDAPSVDGTIVGKRNGNGINYEMVLSTTRYFGVEFYNGGYIYLMDDTTQLALNQWYHLTTVFDDDQNAFRLYLNGKLVKSSSSVTQTVITSNEALLIGAYLDGGNGYGGFIPGSIDEIKVFNYARTPAQIAWDYNRGKPVAHWKFNECQGGSVYDSSGNNNTGTINLNTTGTQTTAIGNGTCTTNASTPWYNGRTGKFNSSLNFDGTDDYVDMGQVSTPTNAITISAWVYPRDTSTDGQRAVVKQLAIGSPWTTYDLVIKGYSSAGINPAFAVSLSNNSQYYTLPQTTTISADTWHHLVGTWSSGNKVKLYIDGRLAGQSTSNTPSLNLSYSASYNTVIGLNPNDGVYSDAKIDDVRIYNYALTSTQVKDLYNNGAVWFGPSTGTP